MNSTYTLADVNTQDPLAVARMVAQIEQSAFPDTSDGDYILAVFQQVADMFNGRFAYFQAMDTLYHNLEHTLQATLCWARMVNCYIEQNGTTLINQEYFRIGLVSILMHDLGYLKEEQDDVGTGAKFTFVHERRSCEMAQICLSASGWSPRDTFAVQHIISCTGPRALIDAIPFRHRSEKLLGQMVATADYLGQMSDPQYVGKLPVLYKEFEESDNYRGVSKHRRLFSSYEDLLEKTPGFWRNVVLPKLTHDCSGLFRYLASPFPGGNNPYIKQVETNITIIEECLKS